MVQLSIKVTPNAKKQRCILSGQGLITIYLTSQPEAGKANKELIAFLSDALNVPKSKIELVQGHISRYKKILIDAPLKLEDIYNRLGLSFQQTI